MHIMCKVPGGETCVVVKVLQSRMSFFLARFSRHKGLEVHPPMFGMHTIIIEYNNHTIIRVVPL